METNAADTIGGLRHEAEGFAETMRQTVGAIVQSAIESNKDANGFVVKGQEHAITAIKHAIAGDEPGAIEAVELALTMLRAVCRGCRHL